MNDTQFLAGVRDAEDIASACLMATHTRDRQGIIQLLSTATERELINVVLILAFWFSRDIEKQL